MQLGASIGFIRRIGLPTSSDPTSETRGIRSAALPPGPRVRRTPRFAVRFYWSVRRPSYQRPPARRPGL